MWTGPDGQRLIHLIASDQCVYVLTKPTLMLSHRSERVYQQSKTGMRRHLATAWADEVSRRNQVTQRMITAHVEFMMGVAKAASGPIRIA